MAKFNPPGELVFDAVTKESWEAWRTRWSRYRSVTKLAESEEPAQIDALIYTMGAEAEHVFLGLVLTAAERKVYKTVLEAFDAYFSPRKNVIFERAQFHRRIQREGEPAEVFIRAVRSMAEQCNFQDKSEQIRDRLVVGTRDMDLSREMQRMSEDDLDEARAIALLRQAEEVTDQMAKLRGPPKEFTHVEHLSRKPEAGATVWNRPRGRGKVGEKGGNCAKCGLSEHPSRGCPAAKVVCHACGTLGHYARCCMSKGQRSRQVNALSGGAGCAQCVGLGVQGEDVDTLCLSQVAVAVGEVADTPEGWFAEVMVDDQSVHFKLDTGAEVSVVPEKVAPRKLERATKKLVGPGNTPLKVLGMFRAVLSTGSRMHVESVFVIQGQQQALLSRDACVRLRLIQIKVDEMSYMPEQENTHTHPHIPPQAKEFPTLFQGLGKIKGVEYKIKLEDTVKPFAVHVPRRVPYPLKDKVRETLGQMVEQGVIFPVTEPTEWCAPIVVVPKGPNADRVRICVDYTQLNKGVLREVYPVAEVEDTLARISGGKVFTKLDANSGFFQIPLAPESKRLTTFLTDEGRFAFHRLPFGLSSCPEVFTKAVADILAGLPGVVFHMDDICVFGSSQSEHDDRLQSVFARLAEAGATLNPSKCTFSQSSIKFLGHVVSDRGVSADPNRIQGIVDFPRPECKKDLRSFMGVINGLGKFSKKLSTLSTPMRDLLCKDVDWAWGVTQEQAFKEVKKELSQTPCLAPYGVFRETVIETDASRVGLGAALFQVQSDGSKRLVCAASRALSGAEQRYAVIELESLCVRWACEKFRTYILGKHFVIRTDHKPLVSLFNDCPLDKLPLRVQRFRLALLSYSFTVEHVPGKENVVADALSRTGVGEDYGDSISSDEVEQFVHSVVDFRATPHRLIQIQAAQNSDEVCSQVRRYVQQGWPHYMSSTESLLCPYFEVRAHLSILEGVLVYDRRIVIPQGERLRTLATIHEGHLGISKCRNRAREGVWWPGMSQSISEMVKHCAVCHRHMAKVVEPLRPSVFPSRPWERLGSDLFYFKGRWFLIIVDYYSRYVEYLPLTDLSSAAVVEVFKQVFARHGIPEVLVSDNGPQYVGSAFRDFVKQWGFEHVTSSPTHSQGNGAAERAVQTVKRLLAKSSDPHLAILSYRASPLDNGFSPAQLLMGRKIRTTVPVLQEVLYPEQCNGQAVAQREIKRQMSAKEAYDHRHKARELPGLTRGDQVWVKDLARYGRVLDPAIGAPRSYLLESGKAQVRRNRNQLVASPQVETRVCRESPSLTPADQTSESGAHTVCNSRPRVEQRVPHSPRCHIHMPPTSTHTGTPPRVENRSRCGRRIVPLDRLDL